MIALRKSLHSYASTYKDNERVMRHVGADSCAKHPNYSIEEVAIGIVSRLVLWEVSLQLREVFHLQGRSMRKRLPGARSSSCRAYIRNKGGGSLTPDREGPATEGHRHI